MTTLPLNPRSERGVALIIVLLLLAVMSGLATGMAINSQVEVAMSSNEMYYAGARAAAEAGLNRAVTAILDTANPANPGNGKNMLYGNDDVANTADDGNIGYMIPNFDGAWPEVLGVTAQYSYTIEIFDDDDNSLYPANLTPAQVAGLLENGDPKLNINDRLIIRATGFGPSGTVVRVARLLESKDVVTPGSSAPSFSNPAILVDGDLTMNGSSFLIQGLQGNVHANNNLTVTGGGSKPQVMGTLTAVGTLTAAANTAVGKQAGNQARINVPDIHAADYKGYADYFLNADGTMHVGSETGPACGALCNGWTKSGSEWTISGTTAPTGTFYVAGTVSISGSPGSAKSPKALAIIATGSISVTGSPFLSLPAPKDPANPGYLQFVTDGDLKLAGAADIDDVTSVEGKSLVREQIQISGNPELQGQVIVQNITTGTLSTVATANSISGNVKITYNGSFQPINTPIFTPGSTTYQNAVSGWMESQ